MCVLQTSSTVVMVKQLSLTTYLVSLNAVRSYVENRNCYLYRPADQVVHVAQLNFVKIYRHENANVQVLWLTPSLNGPCAWSMSVSLYH